MTVTVNLGNRQVRVVAPAQMRQVVVESVLAAVPSPVSVPEVVAAPAIAPPRELRGRKK